MSFYKFDRDDIVFTSITTYPSHTVEMNGTEVTGSVYLEKQFLDTSLSQRRFWNITRNRRTRTKTIQSKTGPFTSSIEFLNAGLSGTTSAPYEKQIYKSIRNLYDYHSFTNINFTASFTGSETTKFRVISIPEIYYDREILTGSFTASDLDSAGNSRVLYDDGLGGIYSGSLTGTLVGNIFYSEGIVVLKGGDLNDYDGSNAFGASSPTNFKWKVNFKGTHKVPVNILKCLAPAGHLNATTNPTFYTVPTGSDEANRGEREIVLSEPYTYITTIGIFNDDYELVAIAKLANPIKKEEKEEILFRVKLDR